MKAKLVEYRWMVDTDMDPNARSGDGERAASGILIPGSYGAVDILVIMNINRIPAYREIPGDIPGNRLWDLNIDCRARDFKEVGEIEISDTLAGETKTMASYARLAQRTNSLFVDILEDLARKEREH